MSRYISIEFGKRFYIGIVLAAASVGMCCLFGQAIIGIAFAIAFVVGGSFTMSEKFNKHLASCLFGIYALATLAVTSIGPNISYRFSYTLMRNDNAFMNFLIVLALFVIVLLISARPRFSLIFIFCLIGAITTVNWFVFHYRGTELTLTDFISIGTAIEVASEYTMRGPGPRLTYVILFEILAAYMTLIFKLSDNMKVRRRIRIVSLVLLITIGSYVSIFSKEDSSSQWRRVGTTRNGLYYNMYLVARESVVKKPDGYSLESIDDLASRYANSKNITKDINAGDMDYPNIIVIMNESWTDIDAMGELHADVQEVTPFINSLTENTIKGTAIVSTYGAGTSRSEFELLTGHTMGFLHSSSIPYQQFIHDEIGSLPTYLKSMGYEVAATHPFRRSGWRRDKVYPLIGLENSTFEEDYPEDIARIRTYVSDQAMYDFMLDKYFSEDHEYPGFLFAITMQNHGGFTYAGDNFEPVINLDKDYYGKDYPRASQYLSLLRYSDEAFENIVDKVSDYDEKTIILMFGDHQVKIEEEFYNKLTDDRYKTNEDEIEYQVPFVIWANFDIEESSGELSSLNYLPIYLMEAAGIELPPYYAFLRDVQKEVPVINNRVCYSSKEGKLIPIDEAKGREAELLNEYAQLQYNNIFDRKNRNPIFFK